MAAPKKDLVKNAESTKEEPKVEVPPVPVMETWLSKALPVLVWIAASGALVMVAIRLASGLGRDFLFALAIIVIGALGLRKGLTGLTRDVAVLAVIAGLFGYALGHFN